MISERSRLGGSIVTAIALAVLFLLCSQALMAQSQNISGTVTDSTGAVIPQAAVKITDSAKGGLARETTTDGTGRFQAINIQPGNYVIAVEKTGFKKVELPVKLDVNMKLDVGNIQMSIGQMAETVAVTAESTPQVQTNTMEKAYLVNQIQISSLPMNGRNWVALMNTVPGLSSSARNDFDTNFNDVSQFHGLGGRGSQNNFYLDGSPNLDVGDNQSQYTQPSIDSIAEFRVLQSTFNAEYGRNSGMAVAVQTKSGASSYHGAAYEYLRNNYFDAKCVLCNTLQPQLRYNQFGGNIGGWLPIPKVSTPSNKKLFFFYNREMTRRVLPASSYSDVPNQRILSGDFREFLTNTNMQWAPEFKNGTVFQAGTITRDGSGHITGGTPFPNNTVPLSQMNPLSTALLKPYLNVPGYANLPAAPNSGYVRYFYNNPSRLEKDQDVLRVDYAVSAKMNTFFRWVNDYQKERNENGIWTGEPFPIQPQERPKPGSSWSWNFVNTFTPTIAAETILSYNHQSQSLSVVGDNPLDRNKLGATFAQLYPYTNLTNSVPSVSASPISYSIGDPGWHNDGKDYALTENVTAIKGKHTFKFGYYYNRDNKKQTSTWPMNGDINFNSNSAMPLDTGSGLANLMLGNFYSYGQASAHVYPYFRFLAHEFYGQDSWKVSKRFTLEYGIRFEHVVPTFTYTRGGTPGGEGTWTLYSVDLAKYNASNRPTINLNTGKIVGDPMKALSGLGLVCDPCEGTPRGFSPATNKFAPRLGFAYDLMGDGKTAIRGGVGVFHERLRQNNFYFGAGGNWPNLTSASQINGNVSAIDTSVTAGTPQITPPGLPVWAADNTVPDIYSWYLGVQRELPWKLTFDGSYSGNRAVHLMDQRLVNGLPAGTFVTNPNLSASVNYRNDALRPYYGWGSLNAIETLSYSRYNAMMLRLSKRYTAGLSFNVNYTLSKAMDIVDNDSDTVRNPYNIAMNWAPAGYDQTHVFTTDVVYDLPRFTASKAAGFIANGWQLTGMFRAQSGMPINIGANGSVQGVDAGSQYADLVGDAYSGNNKFQWLNPGAFKRPAEGSYGSLQRNQLRLPSMTNIDGGINKSFIMTEAMRVTLRAEFYNLLNHPQVWGINTSFSGDNPGSGISANNKAFGQANSYREARIIQLGLRFQF